MTQVVTTLSRTLFRRQPFIRSHKMGFWSSASSALEDKLSSMRSAETKLLSYIERFQHRSKSELEIAVMDTPIPKSSVPIADKASCCLLFPDNNEEQYVLHGVQVTSKNRDLVKTDGDSPPLVLLHGYMNGSAYFYRNLAGLSRYFPSIYSIDLLGMGLSSRPSNPFSSTSTVEQTEDVFCESLEAWRKHHGIDKMVLAGHSMGGYLSVAYTERYPQHVDKLVLLSPVGVNDEPPAGWDDRVAQRSTSTRMMFATFRYLFENQYTPGGVLRSLPTSRSRSMIEGYVKNRLPAIVDEEERQTVADYLYFNAMLPGSTEYCVSRFLTMPYLIAKQPLVHRIPKLQVPSVSFLYGSHDWMDVGGGLKTQLECEAMSTRGEAAPAINVYRVDQAGHLLMLDNWKEFNAGVVLSASAAVAEGVARQQFCHEHSLTLPVKLNPVLDMPSRILAEAQRQPEPAQPVRRQATQSAQPVVN